MSFAVAALVASAVGTGVSFIGQMQQAKASSAIANQNAAMQQQNAQMQADALRTQSAIQRTTAEGNMRLRQMEAAARGANATAIKERAVAQEEIDARNIRKKRDEGARMMATQRARYAAAGVVDSTGSPLSLIAETAGLIQRDIGEQAYANDLARNGLLHEAELERLGGEYALAGATLDYGSELSEAHLRDASASATLLTGQRQAELTRLGGRAQASGYRYGAFGNLLSGAGNAASQYHQFKEWGAIK